MSFRFCFHVSGCHIEVVLFLFHVTSDSCAGGFIGRIVGPCISSALVIAHLSRLACRDQEFGGSGWSLELLLELCRNRWIDRVPLAFPCTYACRRHFGRGVSDEHVTVRGIMLRPA